MPELDEPKTFELVFKATPLFGTGGPKMASAYIGMGIFTADEDGRVFITTEENSFESLKGQIDFVKATLDALLGEAKARFAAST